MDSPHPTLEKLLKRYPIERVVLIADSGLLSLDNLETIRSIEAGGQPLEFILAVLARRYGEFDNLMVDLDHRACATADEEITGEFEWQGFRLVVAHRPDMAAAQRKKRDEKLRPWKRMQRSGPGNSMDRRPATILG